PLAGRDWERGLRFHNRGLSFRPVTDTVAADTAQDASAQLGTRVVSNSLFILAARSVSRVISLVVVIALANSLGDANYGRYNTLVAYSGLVSVLADLGFAPLYTREAARNRGSLGDYLGT